MLTATAVQPFQMADMAILLGDQLSKNVGKTPEGYLICKDVPIARIGKQKYYGREIGVKDAYDRLIDVHRVEDEVFSPSAIASLEGKPVTDGHPPGNFLTPDNYASYAKGHAQNVRRMGDFVVADLVINDPHLISKVENKVLREVSVGYSCYYLPHADSYKQAEIRGNHIAIVDRGRAGHQVSIKDRKPERKKSMKANTKMEVLKALVTADADDAVIENAMKMFDEAPASVTQETEKEPTWVAKLVSHLVTKKVKDESVEEAEEGEAKKQEKAEDRLTKMEDNINKILNRLNKTTDEDEDKKDLDEAMKAEDDAEEEEQKEETEKEPKEDTTDSAREIILQLAKDLAPAVAKLPTKDQTLVKDTLRKAMSGKTNDKNAYAEIQKIIQKKVKTGDKSPQDAAIERGKLIAIERNPHYAKKDKA